MSALQDLTNIEAQTATRMDNNEAESEKKKAKISWSKAMKVIVGKKKEAKKSYTYPPMDPTYY